MGSSITRTSAGGTGLNGLKKRAKWVIFGTVEVIGLVCGDLVCVLLFSSSAS